MQVLHYLLQANPEDRKAATQLGFITSLTSLAKSSDVDVRQAALQALIEILRHPDSSKSDDITQLKDVMGKRVEEFKGKSQEVSKEEQQLANILWQLLQRQS